MTGSFTIPPSGVVIGTYRHRPTAHFDTSRGVSMSVKANASTPVISTWRSVPTSQSVTSLASFQYASSGSPYEAG